MFKWQDILAAALRRAVVRLMPALLGGLIGLLLDAGLLDGELGRALVGLLN